MHRAYALRHCYVLALMLACSLAGHCGEAPAKTLDTEHLLNKASLEEIASAQKFILAQNKQDRQKLAGLQGSSVTMPDGQKPATAKPSPQVEKILQRIKARNALLIKIYENAVKRQPNSWEVLDKFAGYLFDGGGHDEMRAESLWRQALKLNPKSSDLHNDLAVCIGHHGKILEAIDEHRAAIKLNDKVAVYHFNLATMYCLYRHQIRKRDGWTLPETFWKSQAEYERAFELEPTNFNYAMNAAQNFSMARYFEVKDITEKELNAWKAALQIKHNDRQAALALHNIGRIYWKQKAYKKAIDALEQAVQLHKTPGLVRLLDKVRQEAKAQ